MYNTYIHRSHQSLDCVGGFCPGTTILQSDPSAGSQNLVTVKLKLHSPLPAMSRISLTGIFFFSFLVKRLLCTGLT